MSEQTISAEGYSGITQLDPGQEKAPLTGWRGALVRLYQRIPPLYRTLILLALLLAVPYIFAGSGLMMRVFNFILIFSLLSMGLNVISGYTGMFNLGHAAFFGLGAYVTGLGMVKLGQPWWVCLIASAAVTGLAGFLIAFPCLRVATDFLSLITIAFNSVFMTVCLTWVTVTDGPIGVIGVPAPNIFGFVFNTPIRYYYLFLGFAVVIYIALRNILSSRVGRALISIRDDEICAAAQGINVRYYKVLAFVLGTIPAGIAGCLAAGYLRYVSPIPFSFNQSLKIMNMVILGGLGSLPGSVLGAIFFVAVPEIFRPLAVYEVGIGGLIMILLMFFRPQGIMGSAAYAGEGGLQGIIARWRQRVLQRRKGMSPSGLGRVDGTPSAS